MSSSVVVSGHATAAMRHGTIHHLTAGTLFDVPPEPHDSWVVDKPQIVIAFAGGLTE
jgi:hypothetical protein